MADFNALVDDVIKITSRPDLLVETQMAVKSATLQLHRSDFFYKDIREEVLQFNTTDYLQTIDYRTLFPRYRALKYLRKYDPNQGVGSFLKVITPEQVLDGYGAALSDICYAAGAVIQIKSATAMSFAIIGIYENPIVATPETYNSWVSDEAYFAIVYSAAAKMFGGILNNPAKQKYNSEEAFREFLEVSNSNILATGE
jgi:hypothetical protein